MQTKASTLPGREKLQEFTVPEDHEPLGFIRMNCCQQILPRSLQRLYGIAHI